MAKWVGWIAYSLWGILCFFFFSHLLFPYEALGRRILYTLEQKTTLVTRPSDVSIRFVGIRWARVEVSSSSQKAFPPIEIQNWVIQLRPLSLLVGRLSVASHGTVMGGSFHTNLVIERKGNHGVGEWDGIQINRFPLLLMEKASFGGIASGKVLWEIAGQRLEGEALFEMLDGRIENALLSGLTLPLLDLGRIKGQMTWKGEKIDLKEISIAGRDLEAQLTGNVLFQNPFTRSRVACRLEIGLAENLMNRYPVIKALYGNGQGQSKPLVMTIHGTLEAPQVSLTR